MIVLNTRSLGLLVTGIVIFSIQLGFNQPHAAETQNGKTKSLSRHEKGREIYNFRCYYCHGYSGNAHTLAASFMTPKPINFTQQTMESLPRTKMLKTVADGNPNTAMVGFSKVLTQQEIGFVVDFVRSEFIENKAVNTHYHTAENGWPEHQRYRIAFPFATGKLALDTPMEQLSEPERRGKQLYLHSCISCHDRSNVHDEGPAWELHSLSYPRNQYSHKQNPLDATTSASIYAQHDIVPKVANLTAIESQGETLYQNNCAFCHAADGTGRNWIGSFLNVRPRDLTKQQLFSQADRKRLREIIREGLTGTSMPAWKSVLTTEQIDAIVSYIAKVITQPTKLPAKTMQEAL